ncbi:FUSC family protein [Ancylobacter sp. TS-1]|uniref:FUSC family protein n=1 Tax=Ancylobacter sp. TS-1 TaxID=1850374 RepID=UPI001FF05855
MLGTMVAAAYALTAVKLFSQDPLLLVGSAMLWAFACYDSPRREVASVAKNCAPSSNGPSAKQSERPAEKQNPQPRLRVCL